MCMYQPLLALRLMLTGFIFYRHLRKIHKDDKLGAMGDFKFGEVFPSYNYVRRLTLLSKIHGLGSRDKFMTIWKHPHSGHWRMLDYVVVRRSDMCNVKALRCMWGAECLTHHRAKMSLVLRKKMRKFVPKVSERIDVSQNIFNLPHKQLICWNLSTKQILLLCCTK